ncbi:MAG: helix-turn-helix transcriptional regulator [Marinobacterium sp.]|nr:helix-turn-helix transcriptional regulator [Marinobacterium sp.]
MTSTVPTIAERFSINMKNRLDALGWPKRGRQKKLRELWEANTGESISLTSVRKWLTGEAAPQLERIDQLCKMLECDISMLLGDGKQSPTVDKELLKFVASRVQTELHFRGGDSAQLPHLTAVVYDWCARGNPSPSEINSFIDGVFSTPGMERTPMTGSRRKPNPIDEADPPGDVLEPVSYSEISEAKPTQDHGSELSP